MNSKDILQITPVLPVVRIDDLDWAVPLAKALKRGGIGVIEVVLRTPVSLQAIQAIKEQVPEVIVGAGTVLNEEQLVAAIDSGAEFIVTPGLDSATIRCRCLTRCAIDPWCGDGK